MADHDGGGDSLRVAIVGLGPKGLFALERLVHHMRGMRGRASLEVDVFEPHPTPGAGPVYDPCQPDYLRLNVAADILDLWGPDTAAVPNEERLSFQDWRRLWDHDDPGERYPPRALVGGYLADGLVRIRRAAPEGVRITIRPAAVEDVQSAGPSWRVVAGGSAYVYDEILLATGHRSGDDPCTRPWRHAAPLIPLVFPVTRWLSRKRVAPGAAVAVRGFALTFLDAALALTEGRGGAFEADDHPYRLRFVASSECARVILPFSRTGRPMLAKPDPLLAVGAPALEGISESGRAQLLAPLDGFRLAQDLLPILASTTASSLLAARGRRAGGELGRRMEVAAARWLTSASNGASLADPIDPAAEIERSLAVGAGLRPPDVHWALGHTWRSLYPALVARVSGTGLTDDDWPAFHRLAAEMERVAFGPPPLNAAKLLALVEARVVDLTHVSGARIVTIDRVTSIRTEHGGRPVDAVVNAVLPAPGVVGPGGGLAARLVADGHARVLAGRRGLDVTANASCIGAEGARTPGLSAVGRPTEDSVVGNDTLSRTLHAHPDRWASRVAGRSLGRSVPSHDGVRLPSEAA